MPYIRCWQIHLPIALLCTALHDDDDDRDGDGVGEANTQNLNAFEANLHIENYDKNGRERMDTSNDHRIESVGAERERTNESWWVNNDVVSCAKTDSTIILLNNIIFPNICALTWVYSWTLCMWQWLSRRIFSYSFWPCYAREDEEFSESNESDLRRGYIVVIVHRIRLAWP